MKLVTFDEGRVGHVQGDRVVELDVPTMREYFERGAAGEQGEHALADVRLRAPIVPKKFIHTAGNFREHEEESKRVGWSHDIAPWIVFFQNVDAIIGPDEPIVYPEHLTEELDYELELAVVVGKDGKWFGPEDAADYIGGYLIFNDITARDIQRREMRSGVFSFCKGIDTFCPLGPWIVTPDEVGDPHDLRMDPGDPGALLGARVFRRGCLLHGDRERRRGVLGGRGIALLEAGRRGRGRDRTHRSAAKPGDLVAGRPRRALARAGALVTPALDSRAPDSGPRARPRARKDRPPPREGFTHPPPSAVDATGDLLACLCRVRAKSLLR